MANKKISELTAATSISSNYLIPIVDTDANETKKATFQQVIEYVTGSTLNELTASNLSGSDAKFTSLSGNIDWSYIQNTPTTTDNYGITDAVTIDDEQTISGRKTFDTHYITASITGSDAKFTTISANSITANEYNVVTVNRTTLSQEGSTKFGDTSGDTHQFTGSIYAGVVSGTTANFTILNGQIDWNNIQNTPSTIDNYGITDAVTIGGDQAINGRKTFNNHYITASITGNDAKFSSLTSSQILVGTNLEIRNPKGTNYAIGRDSLLNPLSAYANNIAIGEEILKDATVASNNVALGHFSLYRNKVGKENTAIGHCSLLDIRGDESWSGNNPYQNPDIDNISYNTAIGAYSLYSLRSGSYNIGIGNNVGVDEQNFENFLLTGSYNILIGHRAGAGQNNLEKTVILRTDRDVMKIDSAGQLSASSFIGDGSELYNLSSSQITNFTNDVRSQFSAGTDIGIADGVISFTGSVGGVPGGDNFDLQFNKNSSFSGSSNLTYNYNTSTLSGTIAEFSAITSSYFNSQSPAVFVNSAGVTSPTSAFTFKTDTNVTGYLFEVKKDTQPAFNIRYDGYTYIGNTLAVKNAILLSTPTIGSVNFASYRNYLKNARFMGSGSNATPAVRIGSENNSASEKLLSVGRNLYNSSPVDVLDVYGNGDIDIGGSLIANIRVSGSVASPIQSTSYTLSSDDRGKTLLLSASVTQAITCSSGLDLGFNCTFIQMGSGQLIVSGATGVSLLNRQNHTGSAGLYSAVSVVSIDSDTFIFIGETK